LERDSDENDSQENDDAENGGMDSRTDEEEDQNQQRELELEMDRREQEEQQKQSEYEESVAYQEEQQKQLELEADEINQETQKESELEEIQKQQNQYELEDLIKESYGDTKDAFAYYFSGTQGVDWTTFQGQEKELKLLRRASKLDEFVRVDYYIPGCPPQVNLFMQFLNELKGDGEASKPRGIVCSECSRKHVKADTDYFRISPKPTWDANHCFVSRGSICMGFVTKGGCGAVCPRGRLACWGCRGPSEAALKKIEEGNTFDEFMLNSLIKRHPHLADQIKSVMRIFRKHGSSSLKFNRYFIQDRSRIR